MVTDSRYLPSTPFQTILGHLDACFSARAWVGVKTFTEAWFTCYERDWMEWFMDKLEITICTCTGDGLLEDCPISQRAREPLAAIRINYRPAILARLNELYQYEESAMENPT